MFRQSDHAHEPVAIDKKAPKKGYKARRGLATNPLRARQAADDSNFKITIGYFIDPCDLP